MHQVGYRNGALRVWWVPQVPMAAFYVPVESPEQATLLLEMLAAYDAFQLHHRVKADYSNAGGLEVYEGGEWVEWSDDEGDDIDTASAPLPFSLWEINNLPRLSV